MKTWIVFKKRSEEKVFTTTILEILLFKARVVFWSVQQVTGSEKVGISKKLLQKFKSK